MIKVGITGQIGSGKSTISKIFESFRIPVFYSDLEAREILNQKETQKEIENLFGSQVVKNGITDRSQISSIVFSNKEMLDKLNAIVHPKVRIRFEDWASKKNMYPYVLMESAVIFENGLNRSLDQVILVYAPEEIRFRRTQSRDHLTINQFKDRNNNQFSSEVTIPMANFTVKNDDIELIIPQVYNIHQALITDKS